MRRRAASRSAFDREAFAFLHAACTSVTSAACALMSVIETAHGSCDLRARRSGNRGPCHVGKLCGILQPTIRQADADCEFVEVSSQALTVSAKFGIATGL